MDVADAKQVAFDLLTRKAARRLDAPWVCLSVLDEGGHLRAGSHGLPLTIALLVSWPFAKHVLGGGARPWVVAEGARDPVASRTAAVRDGTVAAYIALPIIDSSGAAVGSLCVMDRSPRRWSAAQVDFLRGLAAGVVGDLAARGGIGVHAPSLP
jgi:GAF domain-containing protein